MNQIAIDLAHDIMNDQRHLEVDCSAVLADCASPLLQEVIMVAQEALTDEWRHTLVQKEIDRMLALMAKQLDRSFIGGG